MMTTNRFIQPKQEPAPSRTRTKQLDFFRAFLRNELIAPGKT
jgi:hypothetical protein